MAAIDPRTFETLTPSLFTTFTIPSPTPSPSTAFSLLRVAVLDSPRPVSPRVAAMIVPTGRERDWIFSTKSGQLQLLLASPEVSRLILIGPVADSADDAPIIYNRLIYRNGCTISEDSFIPLLVALSPKICTENGFVDVPFLSFEDDLIGSVVLEKCVGDCVGEMLVEDVEIEVNDGGLRREFRRRLRFKRMPNLVQTEIRIVPRVKVNEDEWLGGSEFEFLLDLGVLVHPYLGPMAASLALIGGEIEERRKVGVRPRALCVGVGGGALLRFLRRVLWFEVVGVEADEEVLRVGRQYFGLEEDEFLQLHIGDGMEELKKHGRAGGDSQCNGFHGITKFDVIMVDLDCDDARDGIMAPPVAFFQRTVLMDAKLALRKTGILVINVIPPDVFYYESLINGFREIFSELFEIDVGNRENLVLIASVSPIESSSSKTESFILNQLRQTNLAEYAYSIKKI